jgi:hypothetical protein
MLVTSAAAVHAVTGGSGFLGQHLGIASEAEDWELLRHRRR